MQIRHPIRRAAASAFVALSLVSSVFAQEGCVTAAAAPVVDTAQELHVYVGSIWHASEPLAVKKAELDRRTQRLAREYGTYSAQCESLDRREWARTQAGVFVPEHPVLNSLLPYNNYNWRANAENGGVGPNNAAPQVTPNYYYARNNTGALFAPPQGPPNPASSRQAPLQQYAPVAPTTYQLQQLPTAVANYAPAVNAAQYANALPPGYTSASANGGPTNYAPVQYAPFQYGPVPNSNANYAPVNAANPQLTTAAPVAPNTNAVPPVMQQQFAPAQYAPTQQVAPGYGIFQQPAPQGVPRGNAVVPPNPTNGGAF